MKHTCVYIICDLWYLMCNLSYVICNIPYIISHVWYLIFRKQYIMYRFYSDMLTYCQWEFLPPGFVICWVDLVETEGLGDFDWWACVCVCVHVSAAFFGTWICPELCENGWVLPGMGQASSNGINPSPHKTKLCIKLEARAATHSPHTLVLDNRVHETPALRPVISLTVQVLIVNARTFMRKPANIKRTGHVWFLISDGDVPVLLLRWIESGKFSIILACPAQQHDKTDTSSGRQTVRVSLALTVWIGSSITTPCNTKLKRCSCQAFGRRGGPRQNERILWSCKPRSNDKKHVQNMRAGQWSGWVSSTQIESERSDNIALIYYMIMTWRVACKSQGQTRRSWS